MKSDPFDLDNLRADAAAMEGIVTKPAKSRRAMATPYPGAFVRYPLEMNHRIGAARNIGAVKMLPLLLHLDWKAGGRPFKLANAALARLHLSREQKREALRELEGLGFIQVTRYARKSPEVTVLR